jgi:RNA polymerase primary sigma factor
MLAENKNWDYMEVEEIIWEAEPEKNVKDELATPKKPRNLRRKVDHSLDKYLKEIGTEPLLATDEEIKLAQLIKSGDDIALDKLTRANLRFVVCVAKQYQNQGLSLGDLINEGNLGLIKAASRFDESRG